MTVLEMISDTYEAGSPVRKDKKEKRKKQNKYAEYSRQGVEISEPAKDEDGDTEPYKEFPTELLESVEESLEAPARCSAEELRNRYKICIGARHSTHPIYQSVLSEVRAYLEGQMVKLRSFDIQSILVHARLNEGKVEYYCQIPTKNFDITGEIDAKGRNISANAEL